MLVERYNFAVDDGVTGKFLKRAQHPWKSAGEILLVARPELGAAPRLATDCTEAVQLQLVLPIVALQQTFDAVAKHRLEGKWLCCGHDREFNQYLNKEEAAINFAAHVLRRTVEDWGADCSLVIALIFVQLTAPVSRRARPALVLNICRLIVSRRCRPGALM